MTHTVGFIGLGNMGSVLAANLAATGHQLVVHDTSRLAQAPGGSHFVGSVDHVARVAETVVLSLPNAGASGNVTRALAACDVRMTNTVIDTSTIGVTAAASIATDLRGAGIGYLDAPVSGGVAGARARTLTVMYAGPDAVCHDAEPVLEGLSDRRVRVGERAGLAQAMKLANNFLAASALAATSEAIAFGTRAGLAMATMLEVLNNASGQSNATSEKFLNQVLTERYAAGFANDLMAKDVDLYLSAVAGQGGPHELGSTVAAVWRAFADDHPGSDFTRIYPYVLGFATEPRSTGD